MKKSYSSIYDVNNLGLFDKKNINNKSYLYYTNLRNTNKNIIIQKKNEIQLPNQKSKILPNNYNNSYHKIHLDNMLNQLKDTINELNNKNYSINIPRKNNYHVNLNNQIKRITPVKRYNLNDKNYNIINRTFHDLYQCSNNSFVEPMNKHRYEEKNEIEYFKLKKRYSITPKRFTCQVEKNLNDNPYSYRNIRKKYSDEKREESYINESKSSSNLHINSLNYEKNNKNFKGEEIKPYIQLSQKKKY